MSLTGRVSGAYENLVPFVRVSGVWEAVSTVWVRVSGAWEAVYTALANPTATPSVLNTNWLGAGPYFADAGNTTASADGTDGTETYAWRQTFTSGSGVFVAGSPNSATTAITASSGSNSPASATFVCDITQNGITVTTNEVTVNVFA